MALQVDPQLYIFFCCCWTLCSWKGTLYRYSVASQRLSLLLYVIVYREYITAHALVKLHYFARDTRQINSFLCICGYDRTARQHYKTYVKPNGEKKKNIVSFFAVFSCIWLVLYTFSTVPEIKWKPLAHSCELINVLRSAYSTPLYISARLQLWQSIQSAALMNPLQSSWEQAGAASFNWPQSNYYLVKPKG